MNIIQALETFAEKGPVPLINERKDLVTTANRVLVSSLSAHQYNDLLKAWRKIPTHGKGELNQLIARMREKYGRSKQIDEGDHITT